MSGRIFDVQCLLSESGDLAFWDIEARQRGDDLPVFPVGLSFAFPVVQTGLNVAFLAHPGPDLAVGTDVKYDDERMQGCQLCAAMDIAFAVEDLPVRVVAFASETVSLSWKNPHLRRTDFQLFRRCFRLQTPKS